MMGTLRGTLATEDFEEEAGVVYVMPEFPAAILLDDIEKKIIKNEGARYGPEFYSYLVHPYPDSHHME